MEKHVNQIVDLSTEEMLAINGGGPIKDFFKKVEDFVAYGIGWMVAMDGVRAGYACDGGNAASVIGYK